MLQGAALFRGDLYYRTVAGLLDAVLTGGVAFENVYGAEFFEHLGNHRGHEADFQASMAGRSAQEAADVVAAYDFTGFPTFVDVGGGRGVLLAAILQAAEGSSGILVDRPAAIPAARADLASAGLADRTECVEVDFFATLPRGADAYVLSRILHDWDDADAERILSSCREAMPPNGRLLIVEAIMPEPPATLRPRSAWTCT